MRALLLAIAALMLAPSALAQEAEPSQPQAEQGLRVAYLTSSGGTFISDYGVVRGEGKVRFWSVLVLRADAQLQSVDGAVSGLWSLHEVQCATHADSILQAAWLLPDATSSPAPSRADARPLNTRLEPAVARLCANQTASAQTVANIEAAIALARAP